MVIDMVSNQLFTLVGWAIPDPGPGFELIVGPPVMQRPFRVGTNRTIRYVFQNATRDFYVCSFLIVVGK